MSDNFLQMISHVFACTKTKSPMYVLGFQNLSNVGLQRQLSTRLPCLALCSGAAPTSSRVFHDGKTIIQQSSTTSTGERVIQSGAVSQCGKHQKLLENQTLRR